MLQDFPIDESQFYDVSFATEGQDEYQNNDANATFEVIQDKSNRGRPKIFDSNGYSYTIKYTRGNYIAFCSIVYYDFLCFIVRYGHTSTTHHGVMYVMYFEIIIMRVLGKVGLEGAHSHLQFYISDLKTSRSLKIFTIIHCFCK